MVILIGAGVPEAVAAGPLEAPTPTATVAPGDGQTLSVGGEGFKGKDQLTRAPAELVLSGASQGAVAATADIRFPADQVTLSSCQLDETLLVSHQLVATTPQPDTMHLVVTARDVTQPSALLPTGVILFCLFTIPEELPPGVVSMEVIDPALTDAQGMPLPVVAGAGGVEIRNFPHNGVTCAIGTPGEGGIGWLILWAVPAMVLIVCRRSRAGACVFALVCLVRAPAVVAQPNPGESSHPATKAEV